MGVISGNKELSGNSETDADVQIFKSNNESMIIDTLVTEIYNMKCKGSCAISKWCKKGQYCMYIT